jgi:hypothetical protein
MKAYGSVDVQTHMFLTSTLVGIEWSASRPDRSNPGENSPPYPLDRRLGELQIWFGRRGEEKILDPTGVTTRTPRSSRP